MKSRRAVVIAAVCLAALAAWLVWREGAGPEREPDDAVGSADAPLDEPHTRRADDGDEERALTERPSAPDAGPGVRMAARADVEAAAVETPAERPSVPAALPHVESRQERSMSSAEKASQTERMVDRLGGRVSRVEQRLAEARAQGDAEEVRRQELILMRLRQRTEALRVRASELAVAAETEDPSQIEPYEDRDRESHPPEHDHDHHDAVP